MLSPKEVVNKWVDAFNDGDVDMIISLYDNKISFSRHFGKHFGTFVFISFQMSAKMDF